MPVLLVNGSLSERSARRYRQVSRLFRSSLSALTHVSARSDVDAARFISIGVPESRVRVNGDMKLDRAAPDLPEFAPELTRLAAGRPVVVAGSVSDAEISLVLDVTRRL